MSSAARFPAPSKDRVVRVAESIHNALLSVADTAPEVTLTTLCALEAAGSKTPPRTAQVSPPARRDDRG